MNEGHPSQDGLRGSAPRWSSFTYLGECGECSDELSPKPGLGDSSQFGDICRASRRQQPASEISENVPPEQAMVSLAAAQVGDWVRIVALNCGDSNSRLMAMGLMPNLVVQVVSRTGTGSVIVALHQHRLGLGADMAQRIQVMAAASLAANPAEDHSDDPVSKSTPTMDTLSPSATAPTLKLREAAIGSRLKVIGYEPTARDYKRKLLAMGLTPGTEVRVTRHAPLGDPTEIEVRNFHLSLRKDEADALIIQPL